MAKREARNRSKTQETQGRNENGRKSVLMNTTVVHGQVDGKLGCHVPTMVHGSPTMQMDHTPNTEEQNPSQPMRTFHDTRSIPPSIVNNRNDR